ncbi:hypothetical protein [Pseudanabaena sp. ABRG5-3]|uniref:hypothetical protein n=1 Tax=Pseudanabaena sp. ABRG5-3 TaxID=685565 RepID=UPI000DC732F3|nr:hypothetical protein [Pseudanabaena sp. ABRG5-3]BBC26970.1 hypothetical protein ABRG53_d005 [Pseudanabaena sp. ABRG5-3]
MPFSEAPNNDRRKAELAKFAAEIVKDPLKLRLLSDRVYDLLTDDLRLQKERIGRNYEGRL